MPDTYDGLVALHKKKYKHELAIEALKEKIDAVSEKLYDKMALDGMASVKLPGGINIRTDRKIWASAGGNVPGLIQALETAGERDLVSETVNATRLTSWVREHDPDKRLSPEEIIEKLPAPVRHAISVKEVNSLIVTGYKK